MRQLALIANDDLIAGILNRNGLVAGNGNRWTRERVTSLRSHHRISVYKPADDGIEPWLNLSNAARLLHISPRTLRLAAQAGEIDAIHPLPDSPWIFSRAALSTLSARERHEFRDRSTASAARGHVNARAPHGPGDPDGLGAYHTWASNAAGHWDVARNVGT